ncbi:hypoxanthine-guanine phosphoribosyltransferase [Marinomonas posidonica]|uniref:Phosphoribosyltransferase n=1 Tax=Marinomonas posidonica (strain CECT 7376 / NCIMB 14433 / IVIA-Po-181) TaxID=491952 RepID=F6CTL3_MARPP|nr:hypoxanthine-guanine phosphoribosyltransferase [Marinomonas posidonica]AEF55128.1 phosphoribosyltransferase [Marinomonas posidonica IVIA-Po-181]
MTNTIDQLNLILDEADCLVDEHQIDAALDKMAQQITTDLGDKLPVVLCVMNGGLIPTAALIERLNFPLELDYIHATRYGMETEGTSLNWLSYPKTNLKGRHILVVDDIFDQGHTLQAISKWLEEQESSAVYTATVINKLHDRKTDMTPDYIGADVVDRFLFGYGMDYKGYFRNLKGIYAVKDS